MASRIDSKEAETIRIETSATESYFGILVRVTLVAILLCGIALRKPKDGPTVMPRPVERPMIAKSEVPETEIPRRVETPKPPPKLDPKPMIASETISKAEAELDAAARDRARADSRLLKAKARLHAATLESAKSISLSRKLLYRVKDPSVRIEQAAARKLALNRDLAALKGEVARLEKTPRPKASPLTDQSPVAKQADGDEFHFEVRRNRVAPIDLDRLIDLVKADAPLRFPVALREGRPVTSRVGPIGSFSLSYEMGIAIPSSLADLRDSGRISYELKGWEIIPEHEGRGESYETAWIPGSAFYRVVRSLSPGHAVITMWVYPDGFPLYRKLRDDLHAQGFLVAARPLPDGAAIRGSPAGSRSAGQ